MRGGSIVRDTLSESLQNFKKFKKQKIWLTVILTVLSLAVSVEVFWILRQPGWTLAGDADCGIREHSHNEECMIGTCICPLSEEPHNHDQNCYEIFCHDSQEKSVLTCDKTEEPHIHTENCYEIRSKEVPSEALLICDLPEIIHMHSEECYECELSEAGETRILICEKQEKIHIHGEECYAASEPETIEENILICELVSVPHEHTDECFTVETVNESVERILICTLSEEAHIHDDTCFEWEQICTLEEHSHSIECYSDPSADAETMLDWQEMFADYPFTGDLREDLAGIAKTQVGYTESTLNFKTDDNGVRHGYTRYGAWYGTPYMDWSAAFVSFCLNYAGADPTQTPGNIGADAMAELWKNQERFTPAGEYVPHAGDIVFFTNNTAAIVTEVYNTTFSLIRGDMGNAVGTDSMLLNDVSIAGWGMTAVFEEEPETAPEDKYASLNTENLNEKFLPVPALDGSETTEDEPTWTDLLDYLSHPDVNGNLSYKLSCDDTPLEPDVNGNYTVDPGIDYELLLRITSDNGLHPGTYLYQLPKGLVVDPDNGTFSLKDQISGEMLEVGDWNVTSDGLITLNFNENMATQSGISIPATLGIRFNVSDEPIDFDGKIKVTVNPPPDLQDPTVLIKWGNQGNAKNTEGKTDPSKIYWTVKIDGKQDSLIPGNVLTDRVISGEWIADHRYTDSDIAAGISFGVTDAAGDWHSWIVHKGDPGLDWTENGWDYIIPETVYCQHGAELELGSNGWVYLVNYSSTPYPSDNNGILTYANRVEADNQSYDSYVNFQHGSVQGKVQKTGSFRANAEGGAFHWEITAVIPGILEGQVAYFWDINDTMNLNNSNGEWLKAITNDADKATVTATHNGNTIPVRRAWEADPADPFAWHISWSSEGIPNTRGISLLCHCTCNENNCPWWDSEAGCGSKPWVTTDTGLVYQDKHFCRCWTAENITTFNITYQTTNLSIIETHGGIGNQLNNVAELYYIPNGDEYQPHSVGRIPANVTIPGLFKKELTKDFDGYTAHYQITVNESKLSLTNGSSLLIRDEMTETLAFIGGSLVITAEDANGNTTVLQQNVDYTYTYDGSGKETDSNKNPIHLLNIDILHAQPVKYIIDYDAILYIKDQNPADVTFQNSASITLWGKEFTDTNISKPDTDFVISAESYEVKLHKTCASTGKSLEGAVFGLYNAQNGQITTGSTDQDGQLSIRTNIVNGIIFRAHELYYLQELEAPAGYMTDDTKHWFVFCSNKADTCNDCTAAMGELTAFRIPYDKVSIIPITNMLTHYDLPATGGCGTYIVILTGAVFIAVPLVYISVQNRKRGRRSRR